MKTPGFLIIIFVSYIFISSSCNRNKETLTSINIMNGVFMPERDTFSFKLVEIGDSIVFKIKYRNMGTEPFRIKNIGIGCDCTTAKWDSVLLQPNDSNTIEVTYKNKADDKSMLRTLVVETNTTKRLHVIYLKGIK